MRSTRYLFLFLSPLLLLGGCSDSSDSKPSEPLPDYDFSALDARLQQFIDDSDLTEGISVTIVDRVQGTVHEAAFGDHPENIIVLLASVSKFPSVTLNMALYEDDSVDFDIDVPIKNYLPWEGVYGEVTTAQLMSNTSGIPGIFSANARDEYACQYDPDYDFEDCAELIYSTELSDSNPPETVFDNGGAQWHLVGAVAAQVTNSEWNQAFDEYVGGPCKLEAFKYGNTAELDDFTGDPDSLVGIGNPHAGGGAIASMTDMAKLLLLHVREGMCGENRIISQEAVRAMQMNRIEGLINPIFPDRSYGMGWWGREELPKSVHYDSGAYGSVAWIDTARMVGGFVAIDDYSRRSASASWNLVLDEIIPLVGQIVDEARLEVGQ
jgi:CubicO group peptidase (beta-lactamase class C family)